MQEIIEETADDKGDNGWDQYYGWGRINVYKALKALCVGSGGFCVKNASGEKVAWFNSFGDLTLDGYLVKHTDHIATDANDEFRFQDSDGNDLAIIDSTDGWMYINGLLYDEQETLDPQGDNNFIIKDSEGDVVAYINDQNGDVYLKGNLYCVGELVEGDNGVPEYGEDGPGVCECDDPADPPVPPCIFKDGKTPKYVRMRFKGIQTSPGVEPVPGIIDIICPQTSGGGAAYWELDNSFPFFWGWWENYYGDTGVHLLSRSNEGLFTAFEVYPNCQTSFNNQNDEWDEGYGGTATVSWGSGIDEEAYLNQ